MTTINWPKGTKTNNKILDTAPSAEWAKEQGLSAAECNIFIDDSVTVQSTNNHTQSPNPLFFVLAHGLFGSSNDFEKLRQLIQDQFQDPLVLVSTANTPNTTQGIRSGGKLLALEIIDYMLQSYGLPKLEKTKNENEEKKEIQYARTNLLQIQRQFSTGKLLLICIGHSLGGLYLRNAIGYLYENLFFHFSEGPISPFEYFSISTPHLGSRRPRSNDLYGSLIKIAMSTVGGLGQYVQTVKDLTLQDEEPILLEMSKKSSSYFRGLKMFTSTAISATHYDKVVPFASSSILIRNPFHKPKESSFLVAGASGFSDDHVNLLLQYADETAFLKTSNSEALDGLEMGNTTMPNDSYINDEDCLVELHSEVYENLNQISWRRIHIQFPASNTLEQLLTHQTPLAKAPNRWVGHIFGINSQADQGELFLIMLVNILKLDVQRYRYKM